MPYNLITMLYKENMKNFKTDTNILIFKNGPRLLSEKSQRKK